MLSIITSGTTLNGITPAAFQPTSELEMTPTLNLGTSPNHDSVSLEFKPHLDENCSRDFLPKHMATTLM